MEKGKAQNSEPKAGYLLPPLIGLAGIACMILISRLQQKAYLPTIALTAYEELNVVFTKQLIVLPISFVAIGLIYLYGRKSSVRFFRKGELFAPAQPLRVLGITEDDTWKQVGPRLAAILASGTAGFMIIAVVRARGVVNLRVLTLFPLALLFSTTNAWSEEMFTRFTVVAGLDGRVRPVHKYWISAAIFGIPHYFGTPGGLVGVVMAGFMGWLLAKSVHETRGMFWAWFIHFVQDVVIFTAYLMMLVGSL